MLATIRTSEFWQRSRCAVARTYSSDFNEEDNEPCSCIDAVLGLGSRLPAPGRHGSDWGLWALVTYLNQRRDLEHRNLLEAERRGQTRLIEAQRPFLEKQLSLYFETARIVGKLVTLDRGAEWDSVERRFWTLYWSELSMVETGNVESAMEGFGRQLNLFKAQPNGGSVGTLQEAGYRLAHAIRDS